jgi:hypothetical protein
VEGLSKVLLRVRKALEVVAKRVGERTSFAG